MFKSVFYNVIKLKVDVFVVEYVYLLCNASHYVPTYIYDTL